MSSYIINPVWLGHCFPNLSLVCLTYPQITCNHIQSSCCSIVCHMLENNHSESDIHEKAIILIYTFKTRTRKAQSNGCIFFLHIGEANPIKGAIAEKTERNPWVLKACAKNNHSMSDKINNNQMKKKKKKKINQVHRSAAVCVFLLRFVERFFILGTIRAEKTERNPWVLKAYAKNNLSMSDKIKDNSKGGKTLKKNNKTSSVKCGCLNSSLTHCRTFLH